MEDLFTTLYDSFGNPIYEGDTIEYFHWCYAHEGVYVEDDYQDVIDELPEGFIERAIKAGYTAEHIIIDGERIRMMKPSVRVVKWNSKYVTYEPVIDSPDDYNNNCFHYVINNCKNDGAYCKVIKSQFTKNLKK